MYKTFTESVRAVRVSAAREETVRGPAPRLKSARGPPRGHNRRKPKDASMNNDAIHARILELEPSLIAVRRDLHKYAETAWTEFRTASTVIRKLRELGWSLTMGKDAVSAGHRMGAPSAAYLKAGQERAVAQGGDPELVALMEGGLTGLWADMTLGNGEGPLVAVRVDMDANDCVECADAQRHRPAREGFASVNAGAMHACGHDGHTAIGLGVAEILPLLKNTLNGRCRLIFQCAEERGSGAAPMVAAGCVDGVGVILGVHLGFQAAAKGDLVCGATGFLATTELDAVFRGKGAHAGAAPHEGKNALLAACAATTNVHAIARHGGGATRINVGKLTGGQGRNVIPPEALMTLETRGETSELDNWMVGEVLRTAKAAADMWGCTLETTVMGRCPSGESSPELAARIREIAAAMPAYTNIAELKYFGASEDFPEMMNLVQKNGGLGSYLQIGTDRAAGHHNDCFDFDERDLAPAVELLVRTVASCLS